MAAVDMRSRQLFASLGKMISVSWMIARLTSSLLMPKALRPDLNTCRSLFVKNDNAFCNTRLKKKEIGIVQIAYCYLSWMQCLVRILWICQAEESCKYLAWHRAVATEGCRLAASELAICCKLVRLSMIKVIAGFSFGDPGYEISNLAIAPASRLSSLDTSSPALVLRSESAKSSLSVNWLWQLWSAWPGFGTLAPHVLDLDHCNHQHLSKACSHNWAEIIINQSERILEGEESSEPFQGIAECR